MERTKLTNKLIVLGVDGFDPSLAKKFMEMGKMPSLKHFVERGAARADLMLLGGMPTVTPPMWTTLATGAAPVVHGITQFFNQHPDKLDTEVYALDSRLCRAEQIWNVTAEAGLKTLVWHWPGSSWPPSSASPNLAVVDGTQPGAVNMGVAAVDWEKLCIADAAFTEVKYTPKNAQANAGAGCVITDLEDIIGDEYAGSEDALEGPHQKAVVDGTKGKVGSEDIWNTQEFKYICVEPEDTEIFVVGREEIDQLESPIRPAKGWLEAPADAKEFMLLTSAGLVRRPCLILANAAGQYDRVAIYRSKKEAAPLRVLRVGDYAADFVDDVQVKGRMKTANRCLQLLELAEDGSRARLWMSMACDVHQDAVFHPKTLLAELNEQVGYLPPISQSSGYIPENAEKFLLPSWDHYSQWQADCLNYLMDAGRYEVIFSHLHNVDLVGHQFWHLAKDREEWDHLEETFYQGCIQYVYEQTDRYLARFEKYLDEGWTVMITSDHGLITEENHPPLLNEEGVNVPVMRELGFTELLKDENGQDTREIDWSRTKAVAIRSTHIYINLKGRNPQGIVEPADQYQLEDEIITALYNYKDPHTGRRVIALALRNRDAVILGLGGPECGDILYFMEEGFNIIHADSLPTQRGYFDTSVSPIFVAAGRGIKAGQTTKRIIRQTDVAPTVAALLGVRMPRECEGAPVYQILDVD